MLWKVMRYLALTLVLAGALWLTSPPPAAAQSVGEYFQLSYDPVSFSKNEIEGSEVFYATIQGRATCSQGLPLPVSEASITSRVVAEHAMNGTSVTLNASYTIAIKPFPSKEGDTTEINQDIPLKFPVQAESGDYNVIGKLTEAKVKIAIGWFNVTDYLPQEQLMGTVKYIATEPAPTSEPTPTPPETQPTASPEYRIVWWVWLIVAIAGTTTVLNLVWFLRHRT